MACAGTKGCASSREKSRLHVSHDPSAHDVYLISIARCIAFAWARKVVRQVEGGNRLYVSRDPSGHGVFDQHSAADSL